MGDKKAIAHTSVADYSMHKIIIKEYNFLLKRWDIFSVTL
jgi:hypothetical protein